MLRRKTIRDASLEDMLSKRVELEIRLNMMEQDPGSKFETAENLALSIAATKFELSSIEKDIRQLRKNS